MGRYKQVENVEVVDAGEKGQMIGKKDGWVYLLQNVIPGDVVDVKAKKKKKSFYEGYPVKFRTYSPYRETPVCEHFGTCGGCKWQNITYQKQLELKEKKVLDVFQRLGNFSNTIRQPILPSPVSERYRNKMDFSASAQRWLTKEEIDSGEEFGNEPGLGLQVQGRFDKVLSINKCHLQPEPSNSIRNAVQEFAIKNNWSFWDPVQHTGFLRSLVMRNSLDHEFLVTLVVSKYHQKSIEGCLNYLSDKFPEIKSLYYVVNGKKNDAISDLPHHHYGGEKYLKDKAGHLKFFVHPCAFYQTNGPHTENLYELVREYAELSGDEYLLDLYCGAGTIGLYLANECRKITGVEVVPEAIDLAYVNAAENNISEVEFFAGEAEKVLDPEFMEKNGKPDVVVVDPPRAGLHKKVVKFLAELQPSRIVYVSCNPATQARDIELLSELYGIEKMRPVDMFPHTPHVENVVLLKKQINAGTTG